MSAEGLTGAGSDGVEIAAGQAPGNAAPNRSATDNATPGHESRGRGALGGGALGGNAPVGTPLGDLVCHPSQRWTLLLSSQACFSFCIEKDRRLIRNPKLLPYELENWLPIDGDQYCVDWIIAGDGIFVVAADAERVGDLMEPTVPPEEVVTAITPRVFAAISELGRTESLQQCDWIVWRSEEGYDLVRMVKGVPTRWLWQANEQIACEVLEDQLAATEDSDSREMAETAVLALNTPLGAGRFPESCQITRGDQVQETLAERYAERLAMGSAAAIVDLRSGPLNRYRNNPRLLSATQWFWFGLAVMQVCLIAAIWFRATTLRNEAAGYSAEQEAFYREVFPGQSVPVGVLSRIQSEHRQLLGTRGMASDAVPQVESVVPTLHQVLAAIPSDEVKNLDTDRLEIRPGVVPLLSGTAGSFEELEKVASGLRSVGFVVPDVSASTTRDGVTMRFENLEQPDAK